VNNFEDDKEKIMQKKLILVALAVCILFLFGCEKSLNIKIAEYSKSNSHNGNLRDHPTAVDKVLNKYIENPSAQIDKKSGTLSITFDYSSQKWFKKYYPTNSFDYYGLGMFVRLYDKNKNKLAEVTIDSNFLPESVVRPALDEISKQLVGGLEYYKPIAIKAVNETFKMKSKTNKIQVSIDLMKADYVDFLEFGFQQKTDAIYLIGATGYADTASEWAP